MRIKERKNESNYIKNKKDFSEKERINKLYLKLKKKIWKKEIKKENSEDERKNTNKKYEKIKHEKIRENSKEFHSKAKRKGVPYFDFAIIQQKWRSLFGRVKCLCQNETNVSRASVQSCKGRQNIGERLTSISWITWPWN